MNNDNPEQDDPNNVNPPSPQDWHDRMPEEMKSHAWSAFAHSAGLKPHPGMYKGKPHPGVPEDAVTEADEERARENEVE